MFEKILVPLDGSAIAASALSHVLAITQKQHSCITLMRVIEPSYGNASIINPTDWQLQRSEANAYLDELVGSCASACEAIVEKAVQEGPPADRILEHAHDHGDDLIVISSHGKGGLSEWNVSSVALKVINRSGISILLVRAYRCPESEWTGAIHPIRYRRILVPLDGSLRAEHVLPIAIQLAEQHDAHLLLVHGVVTPEMFGQTPNGATQNCAIGKIVERNRAQAERYLDEMARRLDVALRTHVLTSVDVPMALHRFADEHEVDLVILSAHGRSARHNWRYGSLTSGFIAYGTTHLLIIQDFSWQELDTESAAQAARAGKVAAMRKIDDYATPPI